MIYLQNDEARQFHTTGTAIALGKFDGVHVGHQLLINGLKKERLTGRKALVFTFGESPMSVLSDSIKKSIYTTDEKAYYFEQLGVDILLEYPFTKEFASCSPEEFIEECLVKQLGVASVYVGEDFRFGKDRSGNVELLKLLGKEYGFDVYALPKKERHGNVVSSTLIRDMLNTQFHVANELLGNPYFVYGEVVHGNHLGRTIGFPTMNQRISEQKLTPAFGVYASRVFINGAYYNAISNLGRKPTIEGEHTVGLETYILDFEGDLYGEKIQVELLFFIRPEEKFSDVDALKAQIQKDIKSMLYRRNLNKSE